MIILGIDPGIATTGYGVIKKLKGVKLKGKKGLRCLGYGLIKTDSFLSDGERLRRLHVQVSKLIKKYEPRVMAVESLFFFKNLKTAFPVSQAKGVILLAAAKKKIPVFEIAPLQAKLAITGYGRAEKEEVQKTIKVLLRLDEIPKPDDAADALAMALACFFLKDLTQIKSGRA